MEGGGEDGGRWRGNTTATHGPNFTVVDGGVAADAGAGTGYNQETLIPR